eukprot:scaffold56_cov390-Pavlova_lutheri.AAC.6
MGDPSGSSTTSIGPGLVPVGEGVGKGYPQEGWEGMGGVVSHERGRGRGDGGGPERRTSS